MASKTVTTLVDDLNGQEEDDVQTVRFGLDGVTFEIDLGPDNREDFYDFLGTYIASARKIPARAASARSGAGRPRNTGSGPARRDKEQMRGLREWARANGYEVSDRGRVPAHVEEAYNTGTPNPEAKGSDDSHDEQHEQEQGGRVLAAV